MLLIGNDNEIKGLKRYLNFELVDVTSNSTKYLGIIFSILKKKKSTKTYEKKE